MELSNPFQFELKENETLEQKKVWKREDGTFEVILIELKESVTFGYNGTF